MGSGRNHIQALDLLVMMDNVIKSQGRVRQIIGHTHMISAEEGTQCSLTDIQVKQDN